MFKKLFFFLLMTFILLSFSSNASALDTIKDLKPPPDMTKPTIPHIPSPKVRAEAYGVIKKQGITTYMYGTHVLVNSNGATLYALKSNTFKLDLYIGRSVTVSGELLEGYPVSGGPEYMNVDKIE